MKKQPFTTKEFFNLKPSGATMTYNRRYKSPPFNFSNSGTIAATEKKLFDFHRDDTTSEKYGSFNNLRISNTSSSEILVYLNQNTSNVLSVPSGSVISADQEVIGGVTSILIENVGSSSITANQIRVQVWKDLQQIENVAANIHKKFFGDFHPFKAFLQGGKKTLNQGAV